MSAYTGERRPSDAAFKAVKDCLEAHFSEGTCPECLDAFAAEAVRAERDVIRLLDSMLKRAMAAEDPDEWLSDGIALLEHPTVLAALREEPR